MASSEQIDNESDALRAELRQYRTDHGLTQKQVSDHLGMTQAGLSAFERGLNYSMRPNKLKLLRELVRHDRLDEERSAIQNILKFSNFGSPPVENDSPSSEDILKGSRAEMKATILRTIGIDAIAVDLVDGMSHEELFKAYLLADRLNSRKN